MTKVLHIIASPRGERSLTRKLGTDIIQKIKVAEQNVKVKEHILTKNPYPHLEEKQIESFFTPKENRTPLQVLAIKKSDDAIGELMEADIIVIGVPMYNFSVPSGLKAYFDHIARAKVTFSYSEKGAEGLLKNKKAYIVVGSAGVFDNDKMRPFDFATPYVKHLLGFLGITDVTTFRIEGTASPELQDEALNKAIARIKAHKFVPIKST
jgi:FMN-dependent NADH-azoreductase